MLSNTILFAKLGGTLDLAYEWYFADSSFRGYYHPRGDLQSKLLDNYQV